MRIVLAAVVLVGCVDSSSPDPGWDPPPGGGPPVDIYCHQDADCPGQVCARDGSCLGASNVYTVHISWTLMGQPASATTCAAAASLAVDFGSSAGGGFGFAPVPCVEGKFSIDKLPLWYSQVSVYREDYQSGGASAAIPRDTGLVMLDLQY